MDKAMISKEAELAQVIQDRRIFGHFCALGNVCIFICLDIKREWSYFGLHSS